METPKKTKQELFAENPDNFYGIEELVMAVTCANEQGQRQVLVNTGSVMEMGGLLFLLFRHCTKMLDMIAIKKAQDHKIVTDLANKKSFGDFIRKR